MTHFSPNSPHARDIASVLHPQTNARRHLEVGPSIISGGEGIRIFDDAGKSYIEGAAALWCASLGFGNERLAKVAYEAMRKLGYYQIFRHASHEARPSIFPRSCSPWRRCRCRRCCCNAPVPRRTTRL